jgi:hypothetical protein
MNASRPEPLWRHPSRLFTEAEIRNRGLAIVAVLTFAITISNYAGLFKHPRIDLVSFSMDFCVQLPSNECTPTQPSRATNLRVAAMFKNTGDDIAKNTVVNQNVTVGGIPAKRDSADTPVDISPGQTFALRFEVGVLNYPDVVNGQKELKSTYEVHYDSKFGQNSRCFQASYRDETQTMKWLPCD